MTMSVTVHRQVSVRVNDQLAWQNSVIGKGTIRAVPPPFDSSFASNSNLDVDSEECLDWEGEIKIHDNVKVGQFDAGGVSVRVSMKSTATFGSFVDQSLGLHYFLCRRTVELCH